MADNDKIMLWRKAIDERLRGILRVCRYPRDLVEVIEYSLFPSGKRLRPILFLAWHDTVCPPTDAAVSFACGIELYHTFTLIHDDMPCLDNDDFRRGKPSVHKTFGESKALLAGDALFALAYTVMLEACSGGQYALTELVSSLFGDRGVISGQYDDVFDNSSSVGDVMKIYERKTAALIYAACVSGALFHSARTAHPDEVKRYIAESALADMDGAMLGANGLDCANAAAYGKSFGTAFQLYDDLSEYSAGECADGASVLEYIGFEDAKRVLNEQIAAAKRAAYDKSSVLVELANKFDIA